MPGDIALKDVTRLTNIIRRTQQQAATGRRDSGAASYVPTAVAEVEALLEAVDFSGCSSFMDPFAGAGTIATVLQRQGFHVVQNDIDPRWQHATRADALQPFFYDYAAVQVIITSPPFEFLDLAAPLMAEKAQVALCLHVPGHWLTNPRVPRQHWLSGLQDQGRLKVLLGLPRGPMHQRCAWVVIGRDSQMLNQIVSSQNILQDLGAHNIAFLGH
jgi:hypothetical protein